MNKVPSEETVPRLKAALKERHIEVIGCIYFDADIFSSSLGGRIPVKGIAVREMKDVFYGILSRVGMPAGGITRI
jgi:CO dehydrogenase nickel-insertion accessory protein CooC1